MSSLLVSTDAGGTSTRTMVWTAGKVISDGILTGPINPSTVGLSDATVAFEELLSRVTALVRVNGQSVKWIVGSAGVSMATVGVWESLVSELIKKCSLDISVTLVNDVVPLLFGSVGAEGRIALVLGTGSCLMGWLPAAEVVRVGGAEYLASDEAGATDLGRAALVAAVRESDGRGRRTSITPRLEAMFSADVQTIARMVAEEAFPKRTLARMAPVLTSAWVDDEDEVAIDIVERALSDLEVIVSAGLRREPRLSSASVVMTGGVVSGCLAYRRRVEAVVRSQLTPSSLVVVSDSVQFGIELLLNGKSQFPSSVAVGFARSWAATSG